MNRRTSGAPAHAVFETQIPRTVVAALACAALAACSAGRIGYTGYDSAYAPGEHNYAGDLPVMVRGNPYGVLQNDLDRAVVAAMRGNAFYNSANFVPAAASQATYRAYVVFGATSATANRICAQGDQLVPEVARASDGAVPLSAVLCRGDRALSEAAGMLAAGGPGSAEFASGVGLFTRALFPARNPHQNGPEVWPLG